MINVFRFVVFLGLIAFLTTGVSADYATVEEPDMSSSGTLQVTVEADTLAIYKRF